MTTWTFTNSRGRVISTENALDAEDYRHRPQFTEVVADADPYEKWTNKRLEDEIEARNDAAGDDEPQIEVEPRATKTQLIAALTANDAARAANA